MSDDKEWHDVLIVNGKQYLGDEVEEYKRKIIGGKTYDKALTEEEVIDEYNELNFDAPCEYIDIPAESLKGIELSEKSSNDYRQVCGHYRGVTYSVVHNPLIDHIHYTIQQGDVTICYTTKEGKLPTNEEMEARMDKGYA